MAELADLPAQAGALDSKMYTVYMIKSKTYNWYYVGLTANLEKRLFQHNSGHERTTRFYRPFHLVHQELFTNRSDARNYEKWLKVRSNKEKVIGLLS